MIGVNTVNISGNVTGKIFFGETSVKKTKACSFTLVSERKGPNNISVYAYVKINAYGENLFDICDKYLKRGVYVYVQGELMNRSGKMGELIEVRANQIIFNASDAVDANYSEEFIETTNNE